MFPETNINTLSVKIINFTSKNEVIVSYADYKSGGIITGSLNQLFDNTQSSPQFHEGFELIYVMNGSMFFKDESEEFSLATGDCIIMNPFYKCILDTPYQTRDQVLLFSVSITLSFLEAFLKESSNFNQFSEQIRRFFTSSMSSYYKDEEYLTFQCKNQLLTPSLSSILRQLHDEIRKKEPGFNQIIPGLFIRILHYLSNDSNYLITNQQIPYYGTDELVRRMKEYLDEHKMKIKLETLSQVFHFHPNYLERAFISKMNLTITEYNRSVYMREAWHLIKSTKLPVSEIATILGFESRSQFYAAFKQYHQLSISEVRHSK